MALRSLRYPFHIGSQLVPGREITSRHHAFRSPLSPDRLLQRSDLLHDLETRSVARERRIRRNCMYAVGTEEGDKGRPWCRSPAVSTRRSISGAGCRCSRCTSLKRALTCRRLRQIHPTAAGYWFPSSEQDTSVLETESIIDPCPRQVNGGVGADEHGRNVTFRFVEASRDVYSIACMRPKGAVIAVGGKYLRE